MSAYTHLIKATTKAKQAGHSGIFTVADLALLLEKKPTTQFRKFLSRVVNTHTGIERIAYGLYINSLMPPNQKGVLEKIASLLHKKHFIYVSLESELSRLGLISQVQFGWLTLMTKGRSGTHKTKYGTVEFIHTKRSLENLKDKVYYDIQTGIFRATPEQAITDLKRVGRNLDMLELENVN